MPSYVFIILTVILSSSKEVVKKENSVPLSLIGANIFYFKMIELS